VRQDLGADGVQVVSWHSAARDPQVERDEGAEETIPIGTVESCGEYMFWFGMYQLLILSLSSKHGDPFYPDPFDTPKKVDF